MKRRTFIAGALVSTAAIAGWRFIGAEDTAAVAKVLYKKLDYLKLDPAGVERFAADFSARKVISKTKLHAIDAAGILYTNLHLDSSNRLFDAIRYGEDRIITVYLISTDFFANSADETRVVQYLGYFDPLRACSNPFARFPETTAS